MRLSLWVLALAACLCADIVDAHGKLLCPKPRQYRNTKPVGWTHWQGITIPGDGSFNPGPSNANNLNAGIGGGVANNFGSQAGSHGICGDIGSRKGFTAPGQYGPEPARGTFVAGGLMEVQASITAWHAGWFEFRLGVPADGGVDTSIPMTQALLNEHVLKIDPSTSDYAAVTNYAGMLGYSGIDGGWYKCAYSGGTPGPTLANPTQGHFDPTSNTPNTLWPHGTCCNDGGDCSNPATNDDRYVVEFSSTVSTTTVSTYTIVLQVPAGISCERCVLQWTYMTANSREAYPEAFWNCADVAIKPAGFTGATGCDVPGPGGSSNSGGGGGGSGPVTPVISSPPPPPVAGVPSSGGGGGGGTTTYTGFCATAWSEYSNGQVAACIPCNAASDCPSNKQCWGSTWCTETALCGAAGVPECSAYSPPPPMTPGTAASPTPPSPPPLTPSQTCGPSSELACTGDYSDCATFQSMCQTWCG